MNDFNCPENSAEEASKSNPVLASQVGTPTERLARYSCSRAVNGERHVFVSSCARSVIVSSDHLVTPRAPPTPRKLTLEWLKWANDLGFKRLLLLLTQDELTFFEGDMLADCKSVFDPDSVVNVRSLNESGAFRTVMVALAAAKEADERVLVSCMTGQVRSANVAALWVHHNRYVTIERAVQLVDDYAKLRGVRRLPSVQGVIKILCPTYTSAPTPPHPTTARNNSSTNSLHLSARSGYSATSIPLARKAAAWSDTSGAQQHHISPLSLTTVVSTSTTQNKNQEENTKNTTVLVLTTGGTIDKDYPRSSGGFAFEFGKSTAVERLLSDTCIASDVGFQFPIKIQRICAKDSTEVTNNDRLAMLKACEKARHMGIRQILITHGTDTLIETAEFLFEMLGVQECCNTSVSGGIGGIDSKGSPTRGHSIDGDVKERVDNFGDNFKGLAVVVTGAMKPERFKDSDAPVNIGVALGALSVMSRSIEKFDSLSSGRKGERNNDGGGVFVSVCMNGVVLPITRKGDVVRDPSSGRFCGGV